MDRMVFLAEAGLLMLKIVGSFCGVMFISYLATLIYDEVQILRQKTPYEIWLAAMVAGEFLIHGKPKKPVRPSSAKYHGHHRAEDTFISDLVVERREDPNSLCYNKKMSFEEEYADLTREELCGVF